MLELEIPLSIRLGHRPGRLAHRAIVLGQPLERFPAKVEPVEIRVRSFQPADDANRVGVVVEPAGVGQRSIERMLAGMAEGRVAKVVRKAQSFGEVLVEPERPGDRAADLRDFDAVGQAHTKMVAVGRDEHLGLVPQSPESDRMDDPVAVALEDVARAARAGVAFGMQAAARSRRMRSQRLRKLHSVPSGTIWSAGELLHLNALTSTVCRSSAKMSASPVLRKGPITSRARSGPLAT